MTFGQINYFITVADEKSFAKAANVLFVSQPAISKSIAKLEEELGFPLLERKNGDLQFTAAGRIMYDFFVKVKDDYRNVMGEISQIITDSSETIYLGCPNMWNPDKFYDKIVNHFRERFPSIRLEIECVRPPELLTKLQKGSFDFVLTHEFYPAPQYNLSVRHLTDTGCGIVYSKKHFSNIKNLSDLSDAVFLIYDIDIEKKFTAFIRNICSDCGFIPHLENTNNFRNAEFVMACGKGAMILTEWDSMATKSAFDYLPLPYSSPISLLYKEKPEKPIIQILADELTRLFAEE